ncbi:universal stress protein UspB [Aliivibrio sp. S3MY1]|uniref:universal stress protein UspB n=1 Tax=Aliivibrio TaxID=511678 RepID=UPI00237962CE|nr:MULTISPECIES: universal stress protein UspB [unclassified Aliivibrio]MDD9195339.1 universal stress protein UspB [Aliivibrio sp. S3MY1]MDD9198938.1 universal stress protein UspB [Aliivibrio sp. S2MY1]
MISGDLILLALFSVTGINIVRYLSTLKTLLFVMKEAHPLLYQQVDGRGFFTTHGNIGKQTKLFQYLWQEEYLDHYDTLFVFKCEKARYLFMLSSALLLVSVAVFFLVISLGI